MEGLQEAYPLSLEQTLEKIRAYRAAVEAGEVERADFWHFCGFLNVDDQTVAELLHSPSAENREMVLALRRHITWIKGQYATAAAWCGNNNSKSNQLLRQDLWGLRLTDKPEKKENTQTELPVRFISSVEDPMG